MQIIRHDTRYCGPENVNRAEYEIQQSVHLE